MNAFFLSLQQLQVPKIRNYGLYEVSEFKSLVHSSRASNEYSRRFHKAYLGLSSGWKAVAVA